MTRKSKYKRHQRRIHEQRQHAIRRLDKEVTRNLRECEVVLKRRKKKVETHIEAEMNKRGFVRMSET